MIVFTCSGNSKLFVVLPVRIRFLCVSCRTGRSLGLAPDLGYKFQQYWIMVSTTNIKKSMNEYLNEWYTQQYEFNSLSLPINNIFPLTIVFLRSDFFCSSNHHFVETRVVCGSHQIVDKVEKLFIFNIWIVFYSSKLLIEFSLNVKICKC